MSKRHTLGNDHTTNSSSIAKRLIYLAIVLVPGVLILGPLFEKAQLSERRQTQPTARTRSGSTVAAPVQASTIAPPAKEYIYAGDRLVATKQPILFEDVSSSNPYYNEIATIARLEVTVGTQGAPHPLYAPTASVTRGQMAAFIMRALGTYTPSAPPSQRFDDVPPSNGFYAFVELMAVNGITYGCSASPPLYCPDSQVLHEQMAAFMNRAVGVPDASIPEPSSQYFCDVTPSSTFHRVIHKYAVDRQIWQGCSCSQSSLPSCQNQASPVKPCFCPEMPVNREQMARILVRNFNLGL